MREERFEHRDIGSVYPPLSLLYCAAVAESEGHQALLMDANGDHSVNLIDILYLIAHKYNTPPGPAPVCPLLQ